MSENSFSVRSRQQDERQITRLQKSFMAGMFNDIPATTIPDDGVYNLKNFVNYGNELVGRAGCKQWGDYNTYTPCAALPSFATGISSTSTAVGNIRTITILSGYTFSDGNIGDWYVHDDGTHERITAVNHSAEIITKTDVETAKDSSTAWLRYQVNALYFHKYLKKIVLFIGSDIYIANDINIASWDKAYCESYIHPANEASLFDEMDTHIILFNSNGTYKLNLNDHPTSTCFYYKINSGILNRYVNADEVINTPYIYRYLVGLAKIEGTNPNRNRQTTNCILRLDSGTNKVNENYRDYWEIGGSNPISSGNPSPIPYLILSQEFDENEDAYKESHWDAYTIWRTMDLGVSGVDPINGEGNNTEQYVWVEDVPIMNSFIVSISGTSVSGVSGAFKYYDAGSYIDIGDGAGGDAIHTIFSVDENANTAVLSAPTSVVSNVEATIGATNAAFFTASGGVLTIVSGFGYFSASNANRIVKMTDGTKFHITSRITDTTANVVETTIISGTPKVGCWVETFRAFNDEATDDDLRPRLAGYPLYQRFYESIPNGNIGIIVPGWLFTTTRDTGWIYYSQIPDGFEYLTGYYHPTYQATLVKDGIRALGELTDKLAVYCANSTYVIPLNTTDSVQIPELGVDISVITGVINADLNIGVQDYGSIANIDAGKQIMITNEPAIRIFNGDSFSENLASKRINNVLKQLQPDTSAIYNPYIGYIFWGNDE